MFEPGLGLGLLVLLKKVLFTSLTVMWLQILLKFCCVMACSHHRQDSFVSSRPSLQYATNKRRRRRLIEVRCMGGQHRSKPPFTQSFRESCTLYIQYTAHSSLYSLSVFSCRVPVPAQYISTWHSNCKWSHRTACSCAD